MKTSQTQKKEKSMTPTASKDLKAILSITSTSMMPMTSFPSSSKTTSLMTIPSSAVSLERNKEVAEGMGTAFLEDLEGLEDLVAHLTTILSLAI